jgi:hypothetical protein
MGSIIRKPVRSFCQAFGIFSEMQQGYSFNDAVSNAERALALDPEYYAPVYSKVLGRLIKSSPWTGGQKSGMDDIRRTFNRGGVSGRDARAGLEGLGLSPSTASQVVRQWEDHMPGFDAAGFEGLGEEPIVLRPNQVEQRRESRMRREAEAAGLSRSEELQGDLFASTERKKSRYNGTLVNEFPEGLEGISPVSASANQFPSRYQVLCELVAPERKRMVASALSGELDSRLYSMYQNAGGLDVVNITNTGENGRVSLKVDTGSGISTEVDLGGNLETGYVVQSINDPLGIFPEGTEQGDFLDFGTVEVVLKSLAAGEGGVVGSGVSRKTARTSLGEWQGISFESMLGRFMSGGVAAEDVIEKGRRSGWTVEEIDDFLWKHGHLPYGIEEYAEHPDWLQDSFEDEDEDEYGEGLVAGSAGSLFSSASPGDHVELRYESEDGSSNKFINMDYSGGPTFIATWGRFGSAGRQTEYPVAQWDSYYRGKRSKGYTDVTDGEEVVPRFRSAPPRKPVVSPASKPDAVFSPPLQKPSRSEPRQLDLFASRRPQISNRFFAKG